MILDNNGVIKKAIEAKNETEQAIHKEEQDLNFIDDFIHKQVNWERVVDKEPGKLETTDDIQYQINSIEDLVEFSKQVNSGNSYENKEIYLMLDLDFSNEKSYANAEDKDLFNDYNADGVIEGIKEELTKGYGFIPIGNKEIWDGSSKTASGNVFKGTFYGQNHTIGNLYMKVQEKTQLYGTVGLFGTNCGIIQDLRITGTIEGESDTNGRIMIGGIAGHNFGKITSCINEVNMKGKGKDYLVYIGGIAGNNNNGTIQNCCNMGTLESSGNATYIRIGGIVSDNTQGSLIRCENRGRVVANGQTTSSCGAAGIVMDNNSVVAQCYNKGSISNTGTAMNNLYTAGVVGFNTGDIDAVYNTGEVISTGKTKNYSYSTGISGYNSGDVQNCYNVGSISNTGTAGGLICAAGLIGYNKGNVSNLYCLENTSTSDVAYNYGVKDKIAVKTSQEMTSDSFVALLGDSYRKDISNENQGYPLLKNEKGE